MMTGIVAGVAAVAAGAGGTPYGFIAAGGVATDTGGGTINPAYPAGFVAGDTLIAFLIGSLAAGVETATTPSGWSLIAEVVGAGGAIFIYGKTADGTEAGTLAITHAGAGGTDQWTAQIYAYGGCAASGQFVDAQTNSGTGTSVVYPSVTLSAANQIKIDIAASTSGTGSAITFTAPSGFVSRGALTPASRACGDFFEKTFVSSGATGTESGNHSISGGWVSCGFGLLAA